jgi:hypothetical protein
VEYTPLVAWRFRMRELCLLRVFALNRSRGRQHQDRSDLLAFSVLSSIQFESVLW